MYIFIYIYIYVYINKYVYIMNAYTHMYVCTYTDIHNVTHT